MKNKVKKILSVLKKPYQIIILDNDTFVEKTSLTASFGVFLVGLLCFFFLFFLVFRGISRLITRDDSYNRNDLVEAYTQIDSLERIAKANATYLDNLKDVMEGEAGETMAEAEKRDAESADFQSTEPEKELSDDEKVLRDLLISGSSSMQNNNVEDVRQRGIASYTFYRPVNGIVSSGFDEKIRHFAVDIATKMNEPIKSTLDGHVVFSSFTPATGYVIIIQHANNLLSLYKHCAALLKKEGSFVRGGEVIALAGSTGELTTGPHLHFELWHNGNAVDPKNYINF